MKNVVYACSVEGGLGSCASISKGINDYLFGQEFPEMGILFDTVRVRCSPFWIPDLLKANWWFRYSDAMSMTNPVHTLFPPLLSMKLCVVWQFRVAEVAPEWTASHLFNTLNEAIQCGTSLSSHLCIHTRFTFT